MNLKEVRFWLVWMALFLGLLAGVDALKHMNEGRVCPQILSNLGMLGWLYSAWYFLKCKWNITVNNLDWNINIINRN